MANVKKKYQSFSFSTYTQPYVYITIFNMDEYYLDIYNINTNI